MKMRCDRVRLNHHLASLAALIGCSGRVGLVARACRKQCMEMRDNVGRGWNCDCGMSLQPDSRNLVIVMLVRLFLWSRKAVPEAICITGRAAASV